MWKSLWLFKYNKVKEKWEEIGNTEVHVDSTFRDFVRYAKVDASGDFVEE